MGRAAHGILEQARGEVARALQADPEEILFVGGGTEACNLALLGVAGHRPGAGRHIVSTALEHPAVSESLNALGGGGWDLTLVKPDRQHGRVTAEAVVGALRADTVLVSVVLVSNETGAVNPVAEISEAIRRSGSSALIHTDAVQALCKLPCAPRALGVDLLSVSAHKIGGIKGAGALWRAPHVRLTPLLRGGGQEAGLRSGTEALPAIAAFGAACRARVGTLAGDIEKMEARRAQLLAGLAGLGGPKGIMVIPPHDAPHIVAFSAPGYPGEALLRFLSDRSVYVSTGSACHKGRRSKALAAMGLPPRVLDGALRVSFSPETTEEDVSALLAALREALGTLAYR